MGKKLTYNSTSIVFVLIVLGFIVVINYLGTKAFTRIDMTQNKIYSISRATKDILRKMDDIVRIDVYFSKDLPPHVKTIENDVRDMLGEYKAYAGKNLRISWKDPSQDEDTRQRVRRLGIPEVQMQSFEQDKASVMKGYLGIAVLYEDKKEVLPVVQNIRNFEYDLTQAILKVKRDDVPKVGVLKTDTTAFIPQNVVRQMRQMRNYEDQTKKQYKPIFENLEENYEVKLVHVADGDSIGSDFRTLIIPGGGNNSFSRRMLYEIDQYFMKGGNCIVLADAMDISMQYGPRANPINPAILDLVEHYGVKVNHNMVLDAQCGHVQIPQNFGGMRMNVSVQYPYFVRVGGEGFNQDNPAVSGLGQMIMPWVSSLDFLVDTVETDTTFAMGVPLVRSSAKSWTVSDNINLDPQQQWQPPKDAMKRHTLIGYLYGSFESYFAGQSVPPADTGDTLTVDEKNRATIDKTKGENHLVVAGDSDFLSQQNANQGSGAWLKNVVDWLTLDDNLIEIRSRGMADRTIRKSELEEESTLRPNVYRYVNVLLMPFVVVCIGIFIFLRRRKTNPAKQ
jgi:gliding-associated putative ABC transporter substrate-binding component GldG